MSNKEKDPFVRMHVGGIMLDPYSNVPIVLLKDEADKYTIPIWIGLVEASAIAIQLEKIAISRPLTHDLLKNIIGLLGAAVERIEVTDLRDNTFFAMIHLIVGDRRMEVDSRPSDAIALALRTESPIFVHQRVIEKSKKVDSKTQAEFSQDNKEKWSELLEKLDASDFGKYKM